MNPFAALKLSLRLASHRLLTFVLRMRSQPYVALDQNPLLILAPHPDDEAFGCGGLIAQACQSGRPVHVAFITDGSASHPGHPRLSRVEIAAVRAEEARRANRLLGVAPDNLHFLNFADGTLAQLSPMQRETVDEALGTLIREISPSEIALPHRRDGSSEHEAAFALVEQSLADSPVLRVLEFPVWSWWSPRLAWRLLTGGTCVHRCGLGVEFTQKQAAIAEYKSQTQPLAPWKTSALPRGFARVFASAEEFYFEHPQS